MIKAILFDFDGTLVDTESISQKLYPKVYKHFGFKITKTQGLLLRSTGYPLKQQLYKQWYGEDMTTNIQTKLWQYFIDEFDKYISKHPIKLKKGVIDTFKYLNSKNIPIIIVSATDKDRVMNQAKQLDIYKYVTSIYSTSCVKLGKPNPDVYLYACKCLNINPNQTLAIEDSPNGVISACKAGIRTIMVPDLTKPSKEFKQLYKFEVIDSLDELIKIV